MPWKDLSPSCSIRTSCTLPSGQEHLHWYPMNGSLVWPTLAWYFRHSISWTWVVPSLLLCFTLMPHFAEPVWHIIQYIVSIFYINAAFLLLYCIKIIYFIAVIEIIAVCLLNLYEEERTKPNNWIPVGWLPVYDKKRLLKDMSPPLLERFACTTSIGSNFSTNGQFWIEFLDG